MSNDTAKQKLIVRIQPGDPYLWAILPELASTPEADLRRILRPHAEASFDYETEGKLIEQRAKMDTVLGNLTLLEIAYELNVVDPVELDVPQIADLAKLFGSEALLRYANAYLYFGIRFLAGRIALPEWLLGTPKDPPVRSTNERPFVLPVPPPCRGSQDDVTAFENFLDLSAPVVNHVALRFLDGFTMRREEPEQFELWLRGMLPELTAEHLPAQSVGQRFRDLEAGMIDWTLARCRFYLSLRQPGEPPSPRANLTEGNVLRPLGGWTVNNPAVARFGLADIYWIARLLRAEVSANATVTYARSSWLHLLRFHAVLNGDSELADKLKQAEEVLRSVFDFVCDLVQDALALTDERERQAYEPELFCTPPPENAQWREVYDEELDEIEKQRARRSFSNWSPPRAVAPPGGQAPPPGIAPPAPPGKGMNWRERIRSGRQPQNLIGLAFSGGGIRSATFNLGVLQGLQEFDLLRSVDYLSTVSGGGFIGSWLAANVSRTSHWLGRLTNWDESIAHLRRYSNYLAPRTGVLSSDTWTMWASWARNAFLIQLTGLSWLFMVLLAGLLGQSLFHKMGELPAFFDGKLPYAGAIAAVANAVLLLTLLYNLRGRRAITGQGKPSSSKLIRWLAVCPAWLAAFLLASLFWADATGRSPAASTFCGLTTYSAILRCAWHAWAPLLLAIWLSLLLIAATTLLRNSWHAIWISSLSVLALYLELCCIMRLFGAWAANPVKYGWYAFVLGPPMVLAVNTISVVLFIGFCGRNSNESLREWWTRFGTWLAIYGGGYLFFTAAAIFGPVWLLLLKHSSSHWTIKWGAILGWIGTVIGGLLAGKSPKTSGDSNKSPVLEVLAKVGGLLFIIGAVLGASTILYVLLFNIGTDLTEPLTYYWKALATISVWTYLAAFAVVLLCGILFSWYFEINIFGLNQFYRNRLVRCYLGATRWAPGVRKPQPFTNFDGLDDMRLCKLKNDYRGPFPIFNCALNLGGSSDLSLHTRHSASFSLTPLRCGADRRRVGYAPTEYGHSGFAGGVMLGQAVAISGAAASPNMGYNTSPLVAFLLTMFNVRLGWWFPNPGRDRWRHPGLQFSLYYLLMELFGIADERNKFINVSDGGHFENLGIYELVRRRCKVIIAADAECDEELTFGSLGNAVRLCETDFGAKIDIDVSSIRQQKDGFSLGHCAIGKIAYSNGSIGHLIYLKASVSGDEDVGVTQYRSGHPTFPHETTADQFFSEDQFESYRQLGLHVIRHSFRGNQAGDHPVAIAEKLADVLAPTGCPSENFLKHAEALERIWERFRKNPNLHPFMDELMTNVITPQDPAIREEEMILGMELIQVMENAFLDLRLDDFWEHPDNRGWAILFMRWARSPRFRAIWAQTRRTFGIRFEYFCAARLGLPRDEPIVRV
jgi:hypothetical protein